MALRSLFNLILSAAIVALGAAPLAADELRDAVDKFLATGATASVANLSQAASEYRQLRGQAPEDDRVEYACALVLLNQRKYANALPLLAKRVTRQPADVEARCVQVWALVQCRHYRDALAALAQLGSRLADSTAASEESRVKALLTHGRLLGYFERVRPGGISTEEVLNVKNAILAQLCKDDIKVLDEGTALTAAKFDELEAARQLRLADRAAAAASARDSVAESLELQTSQAAQTESERNTKTGEANDAARRWSLLRTQIAGLTQDRARVSAQMVAVQTMLQDLYERTYDVGTSGSGTVSQNFERRTVRIEDVARAQQFSLQLAALNKQAFDMDRKLLQYGREAEALRVVGAAQGDAAIRNEQLRQDAMKRAAQLDKRLRQLEREKPAPAPALTAQMRSLATYIPFDYEGERARVLGWFSDSP